MYVGGIGNSGLDGHSSASHHVTNFHHGSHEPEGNMPLKAAPVAAGGTQLTAAPEEKLTLIDALRRTLARGRGFLGRLWGADNGGTQTSGVRDSADGARTAAAGTDPVVTLREDPVRDISHDSLHNARIAAASTAVWPPQSPSGANPYFTTHSDPGKVKDNVFQRIRIRFRDAAGKLAGRFGGRFGERLSGRFSKKRHYHSGRQKPKENLRRRSRYKGDDIELDCVLIDDSYLLDSYDRKGEYSKLTTEKKW